MPDRMPSRPDVDAPSDGLDPASDALVVAPVLVGPETGIREKAKALGVALDGVVVRDPATDPRRAAFEAEYLELRKAKGATPETAAQRMALPHFFAACAVRLGEAAGAARFFAPDRRGRFGGGEGFLDIV